MATKADCVAAAMKGGLTRQEAELAVNALLEDRAKARAARAEGRVVSEEAETARAWGIRMDEARMAAAVARKRAAINILRRRDMEARFAAVKAEGFTGMDALEALPVGSNKRFTGARDSIDAARQAIRKDFLGSLFNELERLDAAPASAGESAVSPSPSRRAARSGASPLPVRKLLEDDGFNAEVIREIVSPDSTGDAPARQVADVMARHMEKARLRMNAAGASIGRLEGYIPQSHDPWKLTQGKNARARWIAAIRDRLDLERSFGMDAATAAAPDGAAEIARILSDVYDNITMGRDTVTAAEKGQRTGPANLADRLGRRRVLHFRDADSWLAYHKEYGRGGALTGVLTHLDRAARSVALMETLGPNPEAMIKSLIAKEARELREASAGGETGQGDMKALKTLRGAQDLKHGKVAAWWAELTGEANWPANVGAARAWAVVRATQTLSKLGGAALSAVADVGIKAMNLRVHGVSWPQAMTESIAQYFRNYDGDTKRLARELGAFIDDVGAEMRLRWDVNEALPGKLAGLQDKFFKWSGLNWITETGKAGFALWFSGHLGEVTGKAWADLDAPRRATLEHHGLTPERWELVRLMTEKGPDGRTFLVPSRADAIPEAALRAHLADDIRRIEKAAHGDTAVIDPAVHRLLDRTRDGLRTDVMRMISDETQYAILEPDARTRAVMRQGTRPGTALGELLRFAMQFKSFPLAYLQREFGGRRWRRGDLAAAGEYDIRGAVGAALAMFAFGYLSMTLKDFAKGRGPRKLRDEKGFKKETVFAALMQSGGAGILGDFFFSSADRFGNSFAGTLAGPALGEAGHIVNAASLGLRGDIRNAGEELARFGMNSAPFVNLWYTREAVNWLMLYHVREWISPGTLRRTERNLQKDFGQAMLVSPAGHIQKGGGFR